MSDFYHSLAELGLILFKYGSVGLFGESEV